MIKIKRVYEKPDKSDGFRILVDRLWPRGLTKEKVVIDLWMKEIAPSDSLRKLVHHDVAKWEEFIDTYKKELVSKSDLISQIVRLEKEHEVVTLLYGAKDEVHNQAVVLKQVING